MTRELRNQDRTRLQKQRARSGHWPGSPQRRSLFVLGMVAVGILFVAGCGRTEPTEAPSVIVAATSTPELSATSTPIAAPSLLPASPTAPVPPTEPPPTQAAANTPTPTEPPPATDTPAPTASPLPSNTPVPPTATSVPPTSTPPPPTRTPLPPTPTSPPPPRFPWQGQIAGTFANCALTRLMGLTLDRNGGVAGDIWVHFWSDGWDGAWSQSTWAVNEGYPGLDDSSNWDGVLDTYAKAGTWHICVVPAQGSWDCRSNTVTAQTTSEPCAPESGGVQIVRIVFRLN